MRSRWVRRLPIAPTYPALVRTAAMSRGTSNLGSWVSTHSAVRSSTGASARNSCGQRTTTSSASGNRLGVANVARASQTVTW